MDLQKPVIFFTCLKTVSSYAIYICGQTYKSYQYLEAMNAVARSCREDGWDGHVQKSTEGKTISKEKDRKTQIKMDGWCDWRPKENGNYRLDREGEK
jgi:hypothetical protein